MTARSILTTVACFLFCTFMQFGGTLAPPPWTIGAGAISAAVFLMLLRFFDVELPFAWLRILLCACVSAAGVAGGFASGNSNLLIWWSPVARLESPSSGGQSLEGWENVASSATGGSGGQ